MPQFLSLGMEMYTLCHHILGVDNLVLFVCFYSVSKLGDFGLLSTVGTIKDYKDFSSSAKHHEKAINILWPGKECCGFNRKCLLWTLLLELSVSSLRQCLGR